MRLLSSECGLKLCEWKLFYRLLDDEAFLHIFRVASSLDSMVVGEPQIISQVKEAWKQAQKIGASGRCLDTRDAEGALRLQARTERAADWKPCRLRSIRRSRARRAKSSERSKASRCY